MSAPVNKAVRNIAEPALDEAARWYARVQSGAMSPTEQAALAAWRHDDPGNEQAWAAVQATHRKLEQLATSPGIAAVRAEALGARPSGARFRHWPLAASLATLMLGVGGGYAIYTRGDQPAAVQRVAATSEQRYRTAVGEMRTIRLTDGSEMTLNTDSTVTLPTWRGERRVRLLRGEGYFRVAKDSAHPFIVETQSGSVRAVGTAFAVRTMPRGFSVALTQGKVSVATPARSAAEMLTAGQQLAVMDGAVKRSESGAAQATSWLAGEVTFRDETLGDAIAEMNRYSARKIVLRDPRAAGRKLSGVFRTGDVGTFVQALTAYGMVRVLSEDANEVRLGGG